MGTGINEYFNISCSVKRILTALGEALLAPVSTVLTFDPFAASLGRLEHGCGNLANPSTFSHFITCYRARVELNSLFFLLK